MQTFIRLTSIVLCLFGTFVFLPSARAEDRWTEVRSPHFRVITDGSEKDGRKVAEQFE